MNNTRFATIVHILTLLASDPEAWLSSDFLASSIMINPVVVRRELGVLRKADWVESRQGKEGGFRLKVSSEQILFKDIYLLVKNVNVLGKQNNNPNPRCPIGKEINNKLDVLAAETEEAVLRSLHGLNLKSFLQQFS